MYGRGKILAHEDNFVVTDDGAELPSRHAAREMTIMDT